MYELSLKPLQERTYLLEAPVRYPFSLLHSSSLGLGLGWAWAGHIVVPQRGVCAQRGTVLRAWQMLFFSIKHLPGA